MLYLIMIVALLSYDCQIAHRIPFTGYAKYYLCSFNDSQYNFTFHFINKEGFNVKDTYKIHQDILLLILDFNFRYHLLLFESWQQHINYNWYLLPKGCSQKDLVAEVGFPF